MSDLIHRDKLKERLFPVVPDPRGVSKTETSLYIQGWNDAITSIIQNEPSAELKKGRWIRNNNGTHSCSVCQSWIPEEQHYYARYCLYCGTKMEVKE